MALKASHREKFACTANYSASEHFSICVCVRTIISRAHARRTFVRALLVLLLLCRWNVAAATTTKSLGFFVSNSTQTHKKDNWPIKTSTTWSKAVQRQIKDSMLNAFDFQSANFDAANKRTIEMTTQQTTRFACLLVGFVSNESEWFAILIPVKLFTSSLSRCSLDLLVLLAIWALELQADDECNCFVQHQPKQQQQHAIDEEAQVTESNRSRKRRRRPMIDKPTSSECVLSC